MRGGVRIYMTTTRLTTTRLGVTRVPCQRESHRGVVDRDQRSDATAENHVGRSHVLAEKSNVLYARRKESRVAR